MFDVRGKRMGAPRRQDSREGQRGFTLIEMSIVIAIIGLLIGGILKGQEVLNNARIKSQVAQVDGIKAAVFTFQDRYGYLPGDIDGHAALGTAANTSGNQNGCIDAGSTGANCTNLADNAGETSTEMVYEWVHMGAANLLGGINLGSGQTVSSATTATLAGKMPSTYLYVGNFSTSVTDTNGNKTTLGSGLAVRLQGLKTGQLGATTNALAATDALAIDTKYDDGLPFTGAIDVVSSSTGCVGSVSATATYTVTTGGAKACDMLWQIQ